MINPLAKWNPFRELEDVQNRLSSLFGRTSLRGLGKETMVSEWTPLVDVVEDDKEYLIKAECQNSKRKESRLPLRTAY